MLDFFKIFNFDTLHVHAIWLAMTYLAVIVAMAADFFTGIHKARKAGVATRSRGYKMTTEKAAKYFLPMICLTCIDVLTSVVLPAPFFTMIMGGFNIFCEWKSVFETTHDKQEIREAANTMNVILKNKEDVAKLFGAMFEEMYKNHHKTIENETNK